MILSITYIELKKPFHFFALSTKAFKIMKQLKTTSCKQYKNMGFWTKHYTMTLWSDEKEMKEFVKSGAHLEAMKTSAEIAKEIRVITIDSDVMVSWKEGKRLLETTSKIIKF